MINKSANFSSKTRHSNKCEKRCIDFVFLLQLFVLAHDLNTLTYLDRSAISGSIYFSIYTIKERMLLVSTVESLPDSPDVIVHQPAEAQAGDAREPHEHVDGGVSVQTPGQKRTHRGADGAAAVNDGGDGGDCLARALINEKQVFRGFIN